MKRREWHKRREREKERERESKRERRGHARHTLVGGNQEGENGLWTQWICEPMDFALIKGQSLR